MSARFFRRECLLDLNSSVPKVPQAALSILLEAALHQITNFRRSLGRQRLPIRLPFEDGRDYVSERFTSEYLSRGEQFIEDTAKGPYLVCRLLLENKKNYQVQPVR